MIRYHGRSLSGKTKVFGVIGDPIEHSLSPAMHNAALGALGLDCIYVPFHVRPEGLSKVVPGMRAFGIRGINVTIPHKVTIMPYLQEIHPVAGLIGAVNTVANVDGHLVGYNTDGVGFLKSLEEEGGRTPEGQHITILGAGGSARAIGFQLALSHPKAIIIANRNEANAKTLANDIETSLDCNVQGIGFESLDNHLPNTDILVNTTPLGMYPHVTEIPPVNLQLLKQSALVCDIVYNPKETRLLKEAKARGLCTLPGLGMLAYQGAVALEIWLKATPPVDTMKSALVRELGIGNGRLAFDAPN